MVGSGCFGSGPPRAGVLRSREVADPLVLGLVASAPGIRRQVPTTGRNARAQESTGHPDAQTTWGEAAEDGFAQRLSIKATSTTDAGTTLAPPWDLILFAKLPIRPGELEGLDPLGSGVPTLPFDVPVAA